MSGTPQTTFTLRSAQDKLGLSRAVLAGLIAAGFVRPTRGPRNEYRLTFQDLALLRTAHALQRSRIPPRQIVRSLARLRASLPDAVPLTGLRITAVGAEVAVREIDGRLAAASGQLLMDFEVAGDGGSVAFLDRTPGPPAGAAAPAPPAASAPSSPPPRTADAAAWFRRGQAAEAADPAAAEAAYRQALALAPDHEDAYLNLGAMLCESGRGADALALYDAGVAHCPLSALVRYNRAIALEDRQRVDDAIADYERSLALDPRLADAHYNLARLREQQGDARGALRHYAAYRRLQR